MYLVVDVIASLRGLLELSLQGFASSLCCLESGPALLSISDQQSAASLQQSLFLSQLLLHPRFLFQLNLQVLKETIQRVRSCHRSMCSV